MDSWLAFPSMIKNCAKSFRLFVCSNTCPRFFSANEDNSSGSANCIAWSANGWKCLDQSFDNGNVWKRTWTQDCFQQAQKKDRDGWPWPRQNPPYPMRKSFAPTARYGDWGVVKTIKPLLTREREMQVRDYEAVVGQRTVVLCCYLFRGLEQRATTDSSTAGELFFACCEIKLMLMAWQLENSPPNLLMKPLVVVIKTFLIGSDLDVKTDILITS